MNRKQRRDAQMQYRSTQGTYLSLRKLAIAPRSILNGNVMNCYLYDDTSICVSLSPGPNVADGDCLIASFSDHFPGLRMPRVLQYRLLYCFGMFRLDENPTKISTYIIANTEPYRSNTIYYYRPVNECRYPDALLRKTYVEGSMTLPDLWEAGNAAKMAQ